MSANLLLDLDDFYNPSAQQSNLSTANTSKPPARPPPSLTQNPINDDPLGDFSTLSVDRQAPQDDDDFGDFETAEEKPQPRSVEQILGVKARPDGEKRQRQSKAKKRDESVLFDAEDEDEEDEGEDEFGEFEGFEDGSAQKTYAQAADPPPPQVRQQVVQQSLIDFDDSQPMIAKPPNFETAAPIRQAEQPASKASLGSGQRKVPPKPKAQSKAPAVQRVVRESEPVEDSDWDDFETSPAPNQSKIENVSNGASPAMAAEAGEPVFLLDPPLGDAVPSSPQANIPPPTILLSTFPKIAETARKQFFDPLSQATGDQEALHAAYGHPQVRSYIVSMVTLSTVLARIIAGRKNRWKRDKILAQSMSISQASAGGRSGGMKLAGLDKAENAREERDVADAVRAWRTILGRLRSAINAAGKIGAIPEIKDVYPIRLATEKEGAIVALKQCILCGLKRSERVAGVDNDVQDSFGEWWVEHWGHRDCARFWNTYEESMKGR